MFTLTEIKLFSGRHKCCATALTSLHVLVERKLRETDRGWNRFATFELNNVRIDALQPISFSLSMYES